jgi:hypothetical protein
MVAAVLLGWSFTVVGAAEGPVQEPDGAAGHEDLWLS